MIGLTTSRFLLLRGRYGHALPGTSPQIKRALHWGHFSGMMDESQESAAEYFKRSVNHQLRYYEKLLDRIPFKDTNNVFEIGCGTAAMSARMAKEIVPNGQVTACDPEESRIRLAMDKFSDIPNLHFIYATGSVALENKADLYDVIVSNAVLHWMKEDELKNTMRKMFTALKSGGIAAHSFIEDLPNTYHILGKIDESKVKGMLEIVHPIQKGKFTDMSIETGFDIVDTESCVFESKFDTVDDLLKTADASTYGLLGWEQLYKDAKSRGLQVEFDISETGKLIHASKLHSFILKKP